MNTEALAGLSQEFLAPREAEPVLRLPLAQLVEGQNEALRQDDLFRRAAKSGLYRRSWQNARVRPEQLQGRAGLRQLPLLSGAELLAAETSSKSLRQALLAFPRIWVTSGGGEQSSHGDQRKWLPLSLRDVAWWFGRIRRLNELLGVGPAGPGTLAWAINEPLPRVSNAVPYLWERVDYLTGGQRIEFIVVAMSMLPRIHWDRFVLQKQPDWILSSVHDARQFVQETDGATGQLERLRRGFFWGEPLDGPEGTRQQLAESYGLDETYSLYLSGECREMYAECPAHDGLHLWMDGAIHEILPDGPKGEPLFVDEAPSGTTGEYVLTTLSEALPLVRYRTGDRIEVVDTQPCACGITHPRVRFLGRMQGVR